MPTFTNFCRNCFLPVFSARTQVGLQAKAAFSYARHAAYDSDSDIIRYTRISLYVFS